MEFTKGRNNRQQQIITNLICGTLALERFCFYVDCHKAPWDGKESQGYQSFGQQHFAMKDNGVSSEC